MLLIIYLNYLFYYRALLPLPWWACLQPLIIIIYVRTTSHLITQARYCCLYIVSDARFSYSVLLGCRSFLPCLFGFPAIHSGIIMVSSLPSPASLAVWSEVLFVRRGELKRREGRKLRKKLIIHPVLLIIFCFFFSFFFSVPFNFFSSFCLVWNFIRLSIKKIK